MKFKILLELIVDKICWLGLLGIASTQALSVNPCLAQSSNIVTDDSLGNETSQIERNSQRIGLPVEIIRGGAQQGINLFHSFREFNVREGRGAYFFSPNAEIQNILTRVTGSNRSEILGTLGTFGNSQPNLFLINPNGILFGENASLDLQGSFVGTTANGVQFGERGVFSATNPEAPALLIVNPSALFFNQVNAQATIQNNSVAPAGTSLAGFRAFGLRVPDGKSLLLLGGDVNINNGGLYAFGGQIELGGYSGTGTIKLNTDSINLGLNFSENVERSDVVLTNSARVVVINSDSGSIAVNARNLQITGNSFLFAGINKGSDKSKAGSIEIKATEAINLTDGSRIVNQVVPEARGEGGDVNIITSNLLIEGGAQVGAGTFGEGKGGSLTINAQDLQIIGRSKNGLSASGLFAPAERNSKGDAGDLTINTDTLLVRDGAQVGVATFGEGKGGNLTIDAQDIRLIGTSNNGLVPTILGSKSEPNSTGNAGNVTITTNTLLVQDGAQVSASTSGKGKGGDLTVNAQDVQLIGISKDVQFNSILSTSADPSSTGDAGNLIIETNKLLVQDGAVVSTLTTGEGKAGDLSINAQDVQLIGKGENGFVSGLSTQAGSNSTGDAGNLIIETDKLLVQDGALVITATFSESKGGDLSINAQDVQLIGEVGLSTQAVPNSTGDAGNLIIETDKLLVQDGAYVSTSTFGKGKGGDLTVNAQDVQLIGTRKDVQFGSGLFTSAEANSTGDAGNLIIETNKLLVQDGAVVSTSTNGKGEGRNLTVNADTLELKNNATIRARSRNLGISGNIEINLKNDFNADNGQISTQSQQSEGGNIKITAGKNIFLRNDSNIRTTLESTDRTGGNINLKANTIIALEDSDILAFAPEGSGGNINFNTRAFLSNPLYRPTPQTAEKETLDALDSNNRTDVNASGSISAGNIIGIPDISFLQDNLTDLPANQIDTNALIASSCIARSNQREENSFTITGSGGLRNNPVNGFIAKFSTGDVRNVEQVSRSWKKGDAIVEPTGAYKLADGRLILGRVCK